MKFSFKKSNILYRIVCFSIILFIVLIALSACRLSEKNSPDESSGVIISGYVRSIKTYEGIGNASITVHKKTTITNSEGYFSLTCNNIDESDLIEVICQDFTYYQKPLNIIDCEQVDIDIYLMPVNTVEIISPDNPDGNIIATDDGAAIFLPPLEGIEERLIVSLTNFDVSTDEIYAVPGDFSALDIDNNDVDLISQGVIAVTIRGETSDSLYTLSGYGDFTVEIPITGDILTAPESIELWYYDNAIGKWKQDGIATKGNISYIGEISHFSVWNADVAHTNNTCIKGNIEDPYAEPDEVYEIKIYRQGFHKRFFQSDTEFKIMNLPLKTVYKISITKKSTGEIFEGEFPTLHIPLADCVDIGSFGPPVANVPPIHDLKITAEDKTIYISWTPPDHSDYNGVDILYGSSYGGGGQEYCNAPAGKTNIVITDYPYMTCELYFYTLYKKSNQNAPFIPRTIGLHTSFILTVKKNASMDFLNIIVNLNNGESVYVYDEQNHEQKWIDKNTHVILSTEPSTDVEWYLNDVSMGEHSSISFDMIDDAYVEIESWGE